MKLFKMLVAGTMLVSSMVFAGATYVLDGNEVEINFEEQFARGLMPAVRFSDDPEAFLGCGVRHTLVDGVIESWAWCTASKSPEIQIICYSFNAEFIDKIASLNHYSFVIFGWDDNFICDHFGFSTQSAQIPDKFQSK